MMLVGFVVMMGLVMVYGEDGFIVVEVEGDGDVMLVV